MVESRLIKAQQISIAHGERIVRAFPIELGRRRGASTGFIAFTFGCRNDEDSLADFEQDSSIDPSI